MKILVIGSVASGKTTFAKQLSQKINIPHYEIDSIVHDDKHNRKRTLKEQKQIIDNINREESWIIEGTLRQGLEFLLVYAEKIIFVDTSLFTRKRRIVTRFIKQKIGLEKSAYKPDFSILKSMFKWTKDFEDNRKDFENKLSKYSKKVIIINKINKRTLQELESFLKK